MNSDGRELTDEEFLAKNIEDVIKTMHAIDEILKQREESEKENER